MSAFRTPPPVEELGDIAWKRIELGLMNKLDGASITTTKSRNKTPWLVGGLVTAVAAAGLFYMVTRSDSQPEATELAQVQISDVATQESRTQMRLLGAEVDVGAHSAISVEQGDQRLRIDLHEGEVRLQVAKRGKMREPVAVVAGDVRVEVMGTQFAVYRHEEAVKVEVFEGVVRVTSHGELSMVRAGESWPSSSAGADVAMDTVRSAKQFRQHKTRRQAKIDVQQARGSEAKVDHESPAELFARAQALEVADADTAIELYEQAARGDTAWSANALFAQARLELSRGHKQVATQLLQSYAHKYPAGANIADVQSLLKE